MFWGIIYACSGFYIFQDSPKVFRKIQILSDGIYLHFIHTCFIYMKSENHTKKNEFDLFNMHDKSRVIFHMEILLSQGRNISRNSSAYSCRNFLKFSFGNVFESSK